MKTAEENQEKEFIIPTRYRTQIGSYLSWPAGAVELTEAFLTVPQIKDLQLEFSDGDSRYPKGKWPASFLVVEAKYTWHRRQNPVMAQIVNTGWSLGISPVPRNIRAEIREALRQGGFRVLVEWFAAHVEYSGREGNLSLRGFWSSETKELAFKTRDYILPEISAAKQRKMK